MRCKNCHTVLMETDPECPCCHASIARATAAPPELTGTPSAMANLLPVFGGAVGGLIYAGLTSGGGLMSGGASAPAVSGYRSGTTGGSSSLKRLFGVALLLGGSLFLVLAAFHARDTWTLAQRQPQVATAADLCRKDYADSAPDWISYTFTQSKPTKAIVKREQFGLAGEVDARCLLVRVENKWLAATVAPGFEGNTLVGRLVRPDSPPTRSLLERLGKQEIKPAALLPYEFNAVDGGAAELQTRYGAAACIAVFGLVVLLLGAYLFRSGRRPAPSHADPAPTGWAYQPPSVR